MAEHITQCPKCHISFRVTDEHLAIANGSVRCGSCLTIFNAKAHFEEFDQFDQEGSDNLLISDETPLDLDDEFDELEDQFLDEFLDDSGTISSDNNLFERELKEEDNPTEEVDDSWALDLLRNEGEIAEESQTAQAVKAHKQRIPPKHVEQVMSITADDMALSDQRALGNVAEEVSYDTRLPQYIEEEQPEPSPVNKVIDNTLSAQFIDFQQPTHKDKFRLSHLFHSRALWFLLSALAALALAGQVAIANIDTWGKHAQWRPYYELACDQLGCRLPELTNVQAITTRNIVIKPDTDAPNALKVSFILENKAPHAQAFPHLEVNFSNHTDQLIATRCFSPSEYLAGELKGRKEMPVNQPIRIGLSIGDPGKEASSYKIEICN